MVSVQEARRIVRDAAKKAQQSIDLPLAKAAGHALHGVIYARVASPAFAQSSMDGYAVHTRDVKTAKSVRIKGENPAGRTTVRRIKKGEAARVFTGSRLPLGTSGVVPQEFARVVDGQLQFLSMKQDPSVYVRAEGAEFRKGQIIAKEKEYLDPATLARLATGGHHLIRVFKKPAITIIITGSELVRPGDNKGHDKVFESNSLMLHAALLQAGFDKVLVKYCRDDKKKLAAIVKKSLSACDVLIFCGGISVGKYDLVNEVLSTSGAQTLFYKVKQKPGKPLYFGKLNRQLIFGLPGNPAAAFTCFYEYVLPALREMAGFKKIFLPQIKANVSTNFSKNDPLSFFLKARYDRGKVHILSGQESYKISALTRANCFVYLSSRMKEYRKGETVLCHLLPDYD